VEKAQRKAALVRELAGQQQPSQQQQQSNGNALPPPPGLFPSPGASGVTPFDTNSLDSIGK